MNSSVVVFLLIGIVIINLSYAANLPTSDESDEEIDEMRRVANLPTSEESDEEVQEMKRAASGRCMN
jgi:hypothetical protein